MTISSRLDRIEKLVGRSSDETCFVVVFTQEGREAEALRYAEEQGWSPKKHWVFLQKFTTPANEVPYIGDPYIGGEQYNLRKLLDDISKSGRKIFDKPQQTDMGQTAH